MTADELIKAHGVGLTGGIATGKSTVAKLLVARGYEVIDADQSARLVTAKGTVGFAAVVAAFGEGVLAGDGTLDRKRLGALVFADPKRRQELEAITHPLVRAALAEALAQRGLTGAPRLFFYEAALLVETKSYDRFRSLWVTSCLPETQLARLTARDGRSLDEARAILSSQMPLAEKVAVADRVIDTNGTLADVERELTKALAAEGASR